ncbi:MULTISPECIES: alkaline phosphatase [unclassified Wenzhouxiangella]|uniref:alkaline phosphatase n=1 Tax=unclassified Wenzhouxiangella TaxID=2613841 RepID=UPI000E327BD9|nr:MULTISPECIES: alkaline phosphatase [unclassified Wenzhouxiangella]RFF26665.1 alkaline phosphatase [Wenzhouxiangella sp. 15181]RFP67584.1 alkaline phosphatase [Wenzhouxiangella sp. 15190]
MNSTILFRISFALSALFIATGAVADESPAQWYQDGESLIAERRAAMDDPGEARNVILFVGDGMSLATVAATRILEGQLRGETGEENMLHFERFRHTGLAKTYNTNRQTPDSAGTMTAMVTGVKSYAGAISVDQNAERGDCASRSGSERVSLLDLAALGGLKTGIVTTTRITHATPAALYSRSVDRDWETDRGIPPSQRDAGCRDIARQFVEYPIGTIDVVFGGGRRAFLPSDETDPEDPDQRGHRGDGRNLINEWQDKYENGHYVWNLEGFEALPRTGDGPVLGLFQPSHMNYEHDRPEDIAGEPSLAAMTAKSIELLADNEHGYFLMIEGGRIDHAHHANNAWRALTDAIAFAKAVKKADEMTGEDTLIIVTADHGHALTFGGYGKRGNPIVGLAERPAAGDKEARLMRDEGDKPMTVLGYANGPGYRDGQRPDFSEVDPQNPDYLQESAVGVWSATHAGEDVPVYAQGPGAGAIHGVFEQNVLFHVIAQALPPLREKAGLLAGEDGLPDWQRLVCPGNL